MSERGGSSTFQDALEMIEGLTLEEKELLFEIAHHRYIEERRVHLAEEVAEAREAYRTGDCRRGTVDDLLEELGT